jgi:hypothetical protein
VPVRRLYSKRVVTVVVTIMLVALAVAATLDLPVYVLAALAAVAVLVPVAERWVMARIGKRRSQRRAPGLKERAAWIERMADQVDGDLEYRLAWVKGHGPARTPLPYRVSDSTEPDADAQELETKDVALLLAHEQELALLGAGGSGKSTLLGIMQAELLKEAGNDASAPVPFLLKVSTWTDPEESLSDWLARAVDELYEIPPGVVHWMYEQRGLVVLLDGLDELDVSRRGRVARVLRAELDGARFRLVVASRPEEYAQVEQELHLARRISVEQMDQARVRQFLTDALQGSWDPVAFEEFVDTPLKLKMVIELDSANRDPPGEGEWPVAPINPSDLVGSYLAQRFADPSREDYGPPISKSEERALAWVAAQMRDQRYVYVDPEAIPYSWAPSGIKRTLLIGLPALLGMVAGGVALWLFGLVVAVLVVAVMWLAYTTDVDFWFGRNPRLVMVASALAVVAAGALLYLLDARVVAVVVVLLALWIYRSGHYAPRYLLAAVLANSVAAAAAQGLAELTSPAVLTVVASSVAWALALVVSAAVLFMPCGTSAKYHIGMEHQELEGPSWLVGLLLGVEVAIKAVALGILPVVAVTAICTFAALAVGAGIAALVAPLIALVMVFLSVVVGARVVDHELPAALRYPLWGAVLVSPLVLLFDDPVKAVLALPLLLELYLAVNFIRGSDAGVFRRAEGGAWVRQLTYRLLLSREHLAPFRFRHLLDRAAQRLVMRRIDHGRHYEFEHALIRDCLADKYRPSEGPAHD